MTVIQGRNLEFYLLFQLFIASTPASKVSEELAYYIKDLEDQVPPCQEHWELIYTELFNQEMIELVEDCWVVLPKGQKHIIQTLNSKNVNLQNLARFYDSNPKGKPTNPGFKLAGLQAFVDAILDQEIELNDEAKIKIAKIIKDLTTLI